MHVLLLIKEIFAFEMWKWRLKFGQGLCLQFRVHNVKYISNNKILLHCVEKENLHITFLLMCDIIVLGYLFFFLFIL